MNLIELKRVVDALAQLDTQAREEYDAVLRKHGTPSIEEQRAWSLKFRVGQAYESASAALDELLESRQ